MSFIIDKQTLDDLNIFSRGRAKSVYSMFNKTHTTGGARTLEEMFRHPLSDITTIERRTNTIGYFINNPMEFPFDIDTFNAVEHYLDNTDTRTQIDVNDKILKKKFQRLLNADSQYQTIYKGVTSIIKLLSELDNFISKIEENLGAGKSIETIDQIKSILEEEALKNISTEKITSKTPISKIAEYDQILRFTMKERLEDILSFIYLIDVYISVAGVARDKGFVIAKAIDGSENILDMKGIYHPHLTNPKENTIHIDESKNIVFLTGANMAGKSTFMKTFGIVIFLAHVGFPVPAKEVNFSVKNGMYTSINLPDNINQGYSHFYAEVLRLKKVALDVNHYKNMVVIFDELFRGTNVKDAFDATVAVTGALAELTHSTFIISTHIMEAGEVLKENHPNVNFLYLPTIMDGDTPKYTYTLAEGITEDRHGMIIINNSKIIEILKNRKNEN